MGRRLPAGTLCPMLPIPRLGSGLALHSRGYGICEACIQQSILSRQRVCKAGQRPSAFV